jgi:N-acylneuraminate cytidylyltransferase
MSNVAIIPARGGSKRIPRKNIKLFLGKPIIAYSIETAINSGIFDYVMVSTDDAEIANIAKSYGAQVPFFRSHQTSNDFSTTADVIIEVLNELKKTGCDYDNACCIYPTAPLLSEKSLVDAYNLLLTKNYNTVLPVCQFSYPVQRALKMDESKVSMICPENLNVRSQDLQKVYHDAGQFYWLKTSTFLENQKMFSENSGAVILNEIQVQDIDNETDWKMAELKHSVLFPKI